MRKYLGTKWRLLKNSKFFLFVLGVVIGATYFYCYTAGTEYINYATIGYKYSMNVINRADASDSLVQAGEPETGSQISDNKPGGDSYLLSSPRGLIARYDWDVKMATAVFKTESGLNPTAMNWNCYYNGKSAQCKVEDRTKAWSVDCGIAQINIKGQTCPEELFNPEINIAKAYEMYQKRGFRPWVAYNMGYHKNNLTN